MTRNRTITGVLAALAVLFSAAPPLAFGATAGAPGPAFTIEATVMADDGNDTCATENHVIVAAGTMLRFCYTMTNTGSEALDLHNVWDTSLGQVLGPDYGIAIAPGESFSFTATGSEMISRFHKVTWRATGADSGTEVDDVDFVYVTILGTELQFEMTVMVDDGTDTCGTASELSVAAGTAVRFCYRMTNTLDLPLGSHYLTDDQFGYLPKTAILDPELDEQVVEPGDGLVLTEVAVIDEPLTNTGGWWARTAIEVIPTIEELEPVWVQGVDSVTIDIAPDTTTTTTTVAGDPCQPSTAPTTTAPPTTSPTTSTTPTTTTVVTTTTSTTTTSTTTTQPPSFTTTTSTTSPVIVLPTTTTTLGEPAGFTGAGPSGRTGHSRSVGHVDAAPCPDSPPGGELPATGTPVSVPLVLGTLAAAAGALAMLVTRRSRS